MAQLKYWNGSAWVEAIVGAKGDTGQGVIDGGTDNQLLAKNGATPYATKWIDQPAAVPSGGLAGQVLTKGSTSYGWASLSSSNSSIKLQSLLDHSKGVPAWNTTSAMSGVSTGYKSTGGTWTANRLHTSVPSFISNPTTIPYNSVRNSIIDDTIVADGSFTNGVNRQVTLRGCYPVALDYSNFSTGIYKSAGQLAPSTDTFYANATNGTSDGLEPTNYANRNPYWIEFDYYGSGFAVKFGSAYAASYPLKKASAWPGGAIPHAAGVTGFNVDYAANVWVWVDGVPVTPQSTPFFLSSSRSGENPDTITNPYTTADNGTTLYQYPVNPDTATVFSDYQAYYYGVEFSSVGHRRIRILSSYFDYGGLVVNKYDTVSPVDVPSTKTMFYGDSWTRGNTNGNRFYSDMYAIRLGEALDTEYFIGGIGGTGYSAKKISTSSDPLYSYTSGGSPVDLSFSSPARLQAITDLDPDLIFICGSVNDSGDTGIAANSSTVYGAFPNTPIIMSGIQPLINTGTGRPSVSDYGSVDQKYRDSAALNANVIGSISTLISQTDPTEDTDGEYVTLANRGWLTQANTLNQGSNAGFVAISNYGEGHLTQAGNVYWANRHYNELVNIITNYLKA
jgi:hypothetical protein